MDNAVLQAAVVDSLAMKSIYFEKDDILHIRVSDNAIVREVSQDLHTNIRSIVEIVLLDAKKEGLMPMELRQTTDTALPVGP